MEFNEMHLTGEISNEDQKNDFDNFEEFDPFDDVFDYSQKVDETDQRNQISTTLQKSSKIILSKGIIDYDLDYPESETESVTSGSEYIPSDDSESDSSDIYDMSIKHKSNSVSNKVSESDFSSGDEISNNLCELESKDKYEYLDQVSSNDNLSNKKQLVKMNNNNEKSLFNEITNDNADINSNTLNESSEVSGLSSLDNSFINMNLKSVGDVLKNKNTEVVASSTEGCKRNSCFYCVKKSIQENNKNMNVLYTKLPEHYVSKHSQEDLVSRLNKLKKMKENMKKNNPKGYSSVKIQNILQKRKKILDYLRIKANHLNNLHAEKASEYVVRRRPNKLGKTVSEFLTCYNCTQVYSESSARKHVRRCTGLSFKKKHVIKVYSRATNGDYHEIASEASIKIISKMRETGALQEIRYDKTVFLWLNAEATRTETQTYKHKGIRASLSRLGTLLVEIKKINDNIQELSDIFNEKYYDDFIQVVKIMGKPDPDTKFMQSPATANDMFNLIKHVYGIYEVKIGPQEKVKRELVQRFDITLRKMWHYSLGSTIAETQSRRGRNVVIELPSKSDSILLNKYLLDEMAESFQNLTENYSDFEYERLRNSLLCYLQSVNARRPGESERLEIEDYEYTKIEGMKCLIIPRGKRRRGVPIVFDITKKKYLDLLVSLRPKAGIFKKNPFIFATIHDVAEKDYGFVSACQLMHKFAINCQASRPGTLKGTRIRMKVATEGMKKGLNDAEVQNLANYMGHTPGIHKQNYRQSVFDVDIAVSKQIRSAQGLENDFNMIEDQTNVSISDNEILNEESCTMETNSIIKPKASASSIKSSKAKKRVNINIDSSSASISEESSNSRPLKLPWLKPSIDALLAHFPNALDLKYKVPSANQINNFLGVTKDPHLKLRSEPQVRSWIHTQRKLKKTDSDIPERDHIPGYIYSCFKSHIDAKKIPSHKRCIKFLANSPSKSNITVSNIQKWVELVIKKRANNTNIKV